MINAFGAVGRVLEAALPSRGVLRVSGSDTLTFLQGLLTKDVTPLGAPQAAPLYAALLNAKGRLVHELVLHRDESAGAGHALLLDCPAPAVDQLAANLTRFKLRADVKVEKAGADLCVVARWSRGLPTISDWDLPDPPDLPADPRHTQLGARGPVQLRDVPEGVPPFSGELLGLQVADERAYRLLRYQLGIAEGPSEIPSAAAIPLEYNLDLLQGVTLDKGCYLGQELIARTHYQGLVRKRVVPVLLDEPLPRESAEAELCGADLFVEGKARRVGTMRGVCGAHGIAHVKLEDAWAALAAKQPLEARLASGVVRVQPVVPRWWPSEMRPGGFKMNLFH